MNRYDGVLVVIIYGWFPMERTYIVNFKPNWVENENIVNVVHQFGSSLGSNKGLSATIITFLYTLNNSPEHDIARFLIFVL